jgi:hypothetical protein
VAGTELKAYNLHRNLKEQEDTGRLCSLRKEVKDADSEGSKAGKEMVQEGQVWI